MKRILIALVVIVALVGGFLLGFTRPRPQSSMEAFKVDVRQVRAAASVGSKVLEKLEAGDIEGAKAEAAPPIAGYYEVYRGFDDQSSYTAELVHQIEGLIPKSHALQVAIDQEKSSGTVDVAKSLLQSGKASDKPK